MGSVSFITNTQGVMTPTIDFIDTGWVIGAGIATHFPCNPGKMTNAGILGIILTHSYVITYDVLNYVSGGVNVGIGSTVGTTRNANGTYTETLLCADNTVLNFLSDGFLSIENLIIYDVVQTTSPITISFSERSKQWTNQQSFVPDMMLRYRNNFFSFQNGAMWKHNDPTVPRCNFYGVQYSSSITFYINSNPGTIKLLQGIVVESNKLWWVPNIFIKPYTGKSLGMQSRIKPGRVEVLQGVFYADFLRNMTDPRFDTQLKALLYGEELRGRVAAITIQNDDTEEVILYKVQIKYSPQMLTP